MSRITVSGKFGTYSADSTTIDLMMARHLPASPAQLRQTLIELQGGDSGLSEVADVTTALVILAEWHEAGDR